MGRERETGRGYIHIQTHNTVNQNQCQPESAKSIVQSWARSRMRNEGVAEVIHLADFSSVHLFTNLYVTEDTSQAKLRTHEPGIHTERSIAI